MDQPQGARDGDHRLKLLDAAVDAGEPDATAGLGLIVRDLTRALGAEMVEIRTGADDFHAPARALYESLGCVQYPTAAYYREL